MKRFSDRIRASLAMFAVAVSPISLMIATPAQAQQVNTNVLRICTGLVDGNYQWVGNEIKSRVTKLFDEVRLIPTEGSRDNEDKLMNNECDAALVQSDVHTNYRVDKPAAIQALSPFKTIFVEYIQVLCPTKTGWTSLEDIGKAKGRLIVGKDGSGPAESWRAMRSANPKLYDPIERIPKAPNNKAASDIKTSPDTCMLWVSGLNSPGMQAANEMSVNTPDRKPSLVLVNVADEKIAEIRGPGNRPLYEMKSITRIEGDGKNKLGMYTNLIRDKGGMFSTDYSVKVPTVEGLLVMRKDYEDAIGDKTPRLVTAIEDALPTIWKRINPGL